MRLKRIQIEKRIRLAILLVLTLAVAAPVFFAYNEFQTTEDPAGNTAAPALWGWVNWGNWDYFVLNKPNDMNFSRIAGPDEEYFDGLVEGIKTRLSYTMATDTPARINGWYEIATDLSSGDELSEHRVVVPRTFFVEENGTNISLELDIDVQREGHLDRLQEIAGEAGISVGEDAAVIYTATVNVNVAADGGSVQQTVNPSIAIPLTGSPTFTISGERSFYDTGVIRSGPVAVPSVSRFDFSGIREPGKLYSLVAIALVTLAALSFGLGTTSPPQVAPADTSAVPENTDPDPLAARHDQQERELRRIRRKYRKRIARGSPGEWLPGREAVPVASMEDLIRVADEVLKPIIYSKPSNQGEPHVFYTIDGPTRYEFRVS